MELFFQRVELFFHRMELSFHRMELFFRPLGLLLVLSLAGPATAQRVGLLVEPAAEAIEPDSFWQRTIAFAEAAATALDVELSVLHADGSPAGALKVLHQAIADTTPVQALLLWDFQEMAVPLAKVCERANIPYLFYGDPPHDEAFAKTGAPLLYRAGAILPDWQAATHQTLLHLAGEARTRFAATPPLEAAGIGGRPTATIYSLQSAGAKDAESEGDFQVRQFVYGGGDREDARRKTAGLLYRYPYLSLLFVGDQAATTGALAEIAARGGRPGADLVLNGVGATAENIEALQQGRLAACVGGDELSAGWGVIVLHDLLQNLSPPVQARQHAHPLYILTEATLRDHPWLFGPPRWEKFDFSAFLQTGAGDEHVVFDLQRIPAKL